MASVKRKRVGAIFVDQVERIDDIALRLRHLLPVLVAHQCVHIDGVERFDRVAVLIFHEVQAHHHHPGDPEEDDVKTGDEHIGLVIFCQFRRLGWPAERGEGPERRREPGVEHVLVSVRMASNGRNSPPFPARKLSARAFE